MADASPWRPDDEALEDCLQALHRAELTGQTGSLATAAQFAGLSASAAATALSELRRRGLVAAGERVALTAEGRRVAVTILRRHRLSERLLAEVLGLPKERAHREAMHLEHVLSPEAEARLDSILQQPPTAPLAARPDGDGSPPLTLERVPAGTRVRILQIREEEPDLLCHLHSLGLLPQAEVTVEEVAPFGGPLLVRVGNARYAIGQEIAATVVVQGGALPRGPRAPRRRPRTGR